jgi:peptidoglycan-associated lipoprotein
MTMRAGFFARLVLSSSLVLGVGTGCALFGGGDEEAAPAATGGEMTSRGTESEIPQQTNLAPVYFDFDMSNIRDDQKPTLQQNATAINGMTSTIVIEGHCDERGSEEYNLALGERRASAVKQYLVDSGVDGGRLETVSFGESSPAVQGSDESAWKWNRRAEFKQR